MANERFYRPSNFKFAIPEDYKCETILRCEQIKDLGIIVSLSSSPSANALENIFKGSDKVGGCPYGWRIRRATHNPSETGG